MQSNKNSVLRCTLLQVVNMSLSTKLTFQGTHTVQPTYVAPNVRPVSRHLVPGNYFLGASSPLCWLNNKEFLCITLTVEHNYISPSSLVGIQLHVSAYMLAIFRL